MVTCKLAWVLCFLSALLLVARTRWFVWSCDLFRFHYEFRIELCFFLFFFLFLLVFVCNARRIISTQRVRHFVDHVTINLDILPVANAETKFAWADGKALIVKKVCNGIQAKLHLSIHNFNLHSQCMRLFNFFFFCLSVSFAAICKRGCHEVHGSCSAPGECV